jgi:protein-disulfide isomerase
MNNKLQRSILLDLKEKCGRNMMLIPITADINLIAVDYIVKKFNITAYPSVIVNQKVFQGLTKMEELEKIVKC